jgi:hypothetical protein
MFGSRFRVYSPYYLDRGAFTQHIMLLVPNGKQLHRSCRRLERPVPNVGRLLSPTDDSASQIVQFADLSASFAQSILIPVQGNLNQTLVSVMADMTEFLAFASQGSFTALPPSLPDQSNYLYFAFNAYLISAALSGNRIYGVIGRGTNPQKKDTNVTNLNYDIDCKWYDEQNVYDSWWYSGNYASAFNLDDFGDMNRNCDPQISNLLQSLTKPASFSSRERWPAMQPAFMASLSTLQSMQAG